MSTATPSAGSFRRSTKLDLLGSSNNPATAGFFGLMNFSRASRQPMLSPARRNARMSSFVSSPCVPLLEASDRTPSLVGYAFLQEAQLRPIPSHSIFPLQRGHLRTASIRSETLASASI